MENATKLIFADLEFTGITLAPRPLSIGLVKENGETLYIEFEQDLTAVDADNLDFLNREVLPLLTEPKISLKEGAEQIKEFVGTKKPTVVFDVGAFDWMTLCFVFGVWDVPFHYIPLDFATVLYEYGYDPDIDRIKLAQELGIDTSSFSLVKHHALSDALLTKKIWDNLIFRRRLS